MSESLGEALPKEMARVRDQIMPAYSSIGLAGSFALAMLRADLGRAADALASGDVVEMVEVYKSLKAYTT